MSALDYILTTRYWDAFGNWVGAKFPPVGEAIKELDHLRAENERLSNQNFDLRTENIKSKKIIAEAIVAINDYDTSKNFEEQGLYKWIMKYD